MKKMKGIKGYIMHKLTMVFVFSIFLIVNANAETALKKSTKTKKPVNVTCKKLEQGLTTQLHFIIQSRQVIEKEIEKFLNEVEKNPEAKSVEHDYAGLAEMKQEFVFLKSLSDLNGCKVNKDILKGYTLNYLK